MKKKRIALVKGDGSAPEMMDVACAIAIEAAKFDGIKIVFEETPMGWNAYHRFGDTLPAESLKRAIEIGTIFFGGVGDFQNDSTIGKERPEMKPEARALLALRKEMGLLLNFRPMFYHKELAHLSNVKPETIPDGGVEQHWIRFLLEDSYFGTADLSSSLRYRTRKALNIKPKKEVKGDEETVAELAYYHRKTIEKYFRAAFVYARERGLPLISIDKANVMARYVLWRETATRIGKEFPDVPLSHQLVDSANALLFTPAKLHGVIACGNEHGDILSDGAAAALGSMGLMCSSAINPDTGAAMFESGAGTAPTLAGTNTANPLGRILTVAMMLRHIGATRGADIIGKAVRSLLLSGFRTIDLISGVETEKGVLGTKEVGKFVLERMNERHI